MNRLLHALCFMLLPVAVTAQSFPFRHYSVKDGLPHANVYAITEDTLGYLWFGTENGLCRFDGQEFISFFKDEDALSRESITALQFTPDGTLYAGTMNNSVYRIGNRRITTLRKSTGSVLAAGSLAVQSGSVFVFHDFINAEVIPDVQGEGFAAQPRPVRFDTLSRPLCSAMLRNGTILVGRQSGLFRIKGGTEQVWNPGDFQSEAVYAIYEEDNGDLFLGCEGSIVHIRDGHVNARIEIPVRSGKKIRLLLRDRYENIWFSFWGDDNLYILDPAGSVFNLFDNSGVSRGIVSRLHKDSNGDVWLSVLGQGVYRFSSLFLRNHVPGPSGQGASITCMEFVSGKHIVFGTHNGLLFYDRALNRYHNFKLSPELLEYVRDIRISGHTVYAGITDMRLAQYPVREKTFVADSDTFQIVYRHASSIELYNGGLLLGNWDNRIEYEPSGFTQATPFLRVFKNLNSLRVSCMAIGNNNILYAGTTMGLVIFDLGTGIRYSIQNEVLSAGINRIVKNQEQDQLMVYSDKGVAVFKSGKLTKCFENTGTTRITAMSDPGPDYLFAGTTNGVYCFTGTDTIHIDMELGLPSNQVSDLRFDPVRGELIVITPNGFSQIRTSALRNYTSAPSRILVSGIETTTQNIRFSGSVELPYTEKLKLLHLSSLDSRDPGQMIRIRTESGHEYLSFSGKFDLSELPPGHHELTICYVADDGTEGRSSRLLINLTPPFYRTTWFYLITGLSGTGLSMLGWRKRRQRIQKKNLEQNRVEYKMNLLKQQALVSNLNPHFIFNALNAIQAFINTNDLQQANQYLALFSRLMRQQLNTAGRDLIPVSEELERLRNYLDVEKLRFGDKLEYTITTEGRISALDVSIPNMIIQPFLENAIWHGFKGMKEPGRISLRLELQENDELIITVTDNGKGFRNLLPLPGAGKDPRGIQLIRQRLELLSEPGTEVLSFSELHPGAALPGTVVTIRLTPIMYRITS